MPVDLVLSSGFLAFARHAGFLAAVEDAGLEVDALCGTSSGALAAAMRAANYRADAIAAELSSRRPVAMLRPHLALWRGALSLRAFVDHLRTLLPPRFEDLAHPLALGVRAPDGRPRLLTSGPLPEAVAASCAIPWLFAPVRHEGTPYHDGGTVDRTALAAFRAWRGPRPTVLHLVERTAGRDVDDDLTSVAVVRTPRSGASFLSLGDFATQAAEARSRAEQVLAALNP
jgi:NTE family protein